MGVLDIFRSFQSGDSKVPNGASNAPAGSPAAQQQQQQVQSAQSVPGNIPPGSGQTVPGNPTAPVVTPPAIPNNPESPLDKFGDIWNTKPNGQGANTPYFNIDQAKVREAAATMDFTSGMDPEKLKAIVAGGEGAVAALASIVNTVGQNVYGNSAIATTQLIEKSLGLAEGKFNSSLEGKLKSFQSTQSFAQENPALRDPKFAPVVDSFRERAITKFPNASPTEINQYVNEYFNGFVKAIQSPELAKQQKDQADRGTDWDSWVGIGNSQ